MINRETVKVLELKPVTRTKCYDFYVKINTEFSTPDALKEAVSWWQDDKEKLNSLWWVLNYHSEMLDPERDLRAFVEKHLDSLASEEKKKEEKTADPEAESSES